MKMMVVGHAAEVPAADQQNATVVSITADGERYRHTAGGNKCTDRFD
jgi:hypothetical protein